LIALWNTRAKSTCIFPRCAAPRPPELRQRRVSNGAVQIIRNVLRAGILLDRRSSAIWRLRMYPREYRCSLDANTGQTRLYWRSSKARSQCETDALASIRRRDRLYLNPSHKDQGVPQRVHPRAQLALDRLSNELPARKTLAIICTAPCYASLF